MSRKPKTQSKMTIVSLTNGSVDELDALDRMCASTLRITGRGRRVSEEESTAIGTLVAALQNLKATGGRVPRNNLTKAHLRNCELVNAICRLGIPVRAGLNQDRQDAMRIGAMNGTDEITSAERIDLSRAAAYYLGQAAKYL